MPTNQPSAAALAAAKEKSLRRKNKMSERERYRLAADAEWHIGPRDSEGGTNTVFVYDGKSPHFDTEVCQVFGIWMSKEPGGIKQREGYPIIKRIVDDHNNALAAKAQPAGGGALAAAAEIMEEFPAMESDELSHDEARIESYLVNCIVRHCPEAPALQAEIDRLQSDYAALKRMADGLAQKAAKCAAWVESNCGEETPLCARMVDDAVFDYRAAFPAQAPSPDGGGEGGKGE